jgi:hypothetical protein
MRRGFRARFRFRRRMDVHARSRRRFPARHAGHSTRPPLIVTPPVIDVTEDPSITSRPRAPHPGQTGTTPAGENSTE